MTVMVSVLSEPQRCNPCYQQYSHADTIVGCFDEQSINPDCKPKIHFAQTIFFFIVPVGTSNYCFFFLSIYVNAFNEKQFCRTGTCFCSEMI